MIDSVSLTARKWSCALLCAAISCACLNIIPAYSAQKQRPDPFQMPLALDPWNERETKNHQLRGVEQDLTTSTVRQNEVSQVLEMSRTEKDSLVRELAASGQNMRKIEEGVVVLEQRLTQFEAEEYKRRAYVKSKQATYIEILAALQRISINPPPALLLNWQHTLSTVRSAALLEQLAPHLRVEASIMAENFDRLVLVRRSISQDRDMLAKELASLSGARSKITALIDEKKKLEAGASLELAGIRKRTEQLAAQSESLKDLIAKLETDINAANAQTRLKQGVKGGVGGPEATLSNLRSLKEFSTMETPQQRLAAYNFHALKNAIALPVAGQKLRSFNEPDPLGNASKGIVLATRATAQVISPTIGVVLYAGTFRSYGQMVILNVGGGYHMLVAGMEKVHVYPGQLIEAGEPLGEMGVRAATTMVAFAAQHNTTSPILYLELRKDGQIIDPSPWLISSQFNEARE